MVLLTILYIPLNVVTAVFLSDFAHLGLLWPSFQKNLYAHPIGWGIAQGIIAPAVQYLGSSFFPRFSVAFTIIQETFQRRPANDTSPVVCIYSS